MTTRSTAGALALGAALVTTSIAGCTGDPEPTDVGTAGLTNADPVVTGNGAPSTDPAAIQFHFDPVDTEDGRVFDTLTLFPQYGGSASWDPATLVEGDPSTYPPAGFAFAVEIRDTLGQIILESEPRVMFASDFLAGEGATPTSPFASSRWIFHPVSGDVVEVDPATPGAAEWLAQTERFVLEVASSGWDTIVEPPGDDEPPTTDPTPIDPMPLPPVEAPGTPLDGGEHAPGQARHAGSHDTGVATGLLATSTAREIPGADDSWAEILMTCWDAANEAWHWYQIFEEKCYKGQPPKFEWSVKCGWAISGLTNKSLQALACAYVMADKLGIVPTNEGTRKLLKALLVSYALSGKPNDLPKLPPPPAIVKPKDK